MVKEINIIDVASVLAHNDTAKKYNLPITTHFEDVKDGFGEDELSPIEFFNRKYDYYFEILLENSDN